VTWRPLAAATAAALAAGAIQRARYGQAFAVQHKGVVDLVTEIDHACEAAVLSVLQERFPDHDIVTEESAPLRHGSPYCWYVDPLDGTTNFAHGYPMFCVSIALVKDGEPIVGVVYDALHEELYTAERGAGAHLNGRRLQVSSAAKLVDGLLVTGFPYEIRDVVGPTVALLQAFLGVAQGVRRDGAAALDLAWLAAGRLDGYWEERLKPWDLLAGSLLVQEAGGRVTRFDDSPLGVRADQVVASNGLLHPAMLDVIARSRAA
jgi:myo-inositol-1(or 4)-monophosphatase